MGSPAKKKVRGFEDNEDRISRLPDELIHKILSFVDAKVAVQTSVLSKRWKLIWVTLPFLSFGRYENCLPNKTYMFIHHVLSNRNHQSHLSELKLFVSKKFCVSKKTLHGCLLEKFIDYAISHNVKCINLDLTYNHTPYKLSTFSSNSLKKLELQMRLAFESECWDLPALTTLHLKRPVLDEYYKLSDSCLTCLPALRMLCLDNWDLSLSSFSFSLPALTTLRLSKCKLPQTVWDFPALLSLELDGVDLPENMSDIFSALVNLQNLTLFLRVWYMKRDYFISCPQLLNLNITANGSISPYAIVVLAPKLCNFTSLGIFTITFGIPELENVNIKLRGWVENMKCEYRKKHYRRFTNMFPGLGNAKNLTFDMESIEALSMISDFLASFPSPFYNLRYVKLPQGYKESSISSALRSYLLGGSPRATIVTTLPQKMIPEIEAVSVTAQNVLLQEPMAAPIKEQVDTQYIHQTLSVDSVDMRVQEEHVVEDSVVEADRVRNIDAPVEGTSKDQVISSRGNRDFRLWRGYEIKSEFVSLLDRIMHNYPETFEHFTTKNKKLCTMRLHMLCTSLNELTKISVNEVDSDIIVEYRDVFAYLQNQGLDVSWVVNRLNFIEHLRFSKPLVPELHAIDCRIDEDESKLQELQACLDDAKSKLQDLQSRVDEAKTKLQYVQNLRAEKMREIQNAFGTVGTYLAVGFIGDDLLSGP